MSGARARTLGSHGDQKDHTPLERLNEGWKVNPGWKCEIFTTFGARFPVNDANKQHCFAEKPGMTAAMPTPVRAIVFDVGYTLIDEARQWASWAAEMGRSETEFMAALKSVIRERQHHREVFKRLDPDFDLQAAYRRRDATDDNIWEEQDLYPDARAALTRLKARGFQIGLAGNQPHKARHALECLTLPVDWIANSAELGAEKPAPEFFARIAAKAGMPASNIAYVGDRLDNDILPAQAAGMRGAFLVRGPWGEAHAKWPEASMAQHTIQSLDDLWPELSKD